MFRFHIQAKLNGDETEDASVTPFVLTMRSDANINNVLGCGSYASLAAAKTEAAAIVKATLTWHDASDSLSSFTSIFNI